MSRDSHELDIIDFPARTPDGTVIRSYLPRYILRKAAKATQGHGYITHLYWTVETGKYPAATTSTYPPGLPYEFAYHFTVNGRRVHVHKRKAI